MKTINIAMITLLAFGLLTPRDNYAQCISCQRFCFSTGGPQSANSCNGGDEKFCEDVTVDVKLADPEAEVMIEITDASGEIVAAETVDGESGSVTACVDPACYEVSIESVTSSQLAEVGDFSVTTDQAPVLSEVALPANQSVGMSSGGCGGSPKKEEERLSVAKMASTYFSAYPNPFSRSAIIEYAMADDDHVILEVFNSMGGKVRTLFNGSAEGGITYKHSFEADGLAAGLYFLRLSSTAQGTQYRKLQIIR